MSTIEKGIVYSTANEWDVVSTQYFQCWLHQKIYWTMSPF